MEINKKSLTHSLIIGEQRFEMEGKLENGCEMRDKQDYIIVQSMTGLQVHDSGEESGVEEEGCNIHYE
jgi:hypothetical protein